VKWYYFASYNNTEELFKFMLQCESPMSKDSTWREENNNNNNNNFNNNCQVPPVKLPGDVKDATAIHFMNTGICSIIIIIIIIFFLVYNLTWHRMFSNKVLTDDSKLLQKSNFNG